MNRYRTAMIGGWLFLLAGVSQAATISINLNAATLPGSPGSGLTFTGTLTNTTGSTVFLNAAGLNLAGFDPANEDASPFFANAPLSLAGNTSTSMIDLFAINIPNPFVAGPYTGTFTILGGTDGNAQDPIGSANFTVQVASGGGPSVPEPRTITLAIVGGLFIISRVRRRSGNQHLATVVGTRRGNSL